MRKEQIKIGGTYSAKVSSKIVPVRIDSVHPNGGWEATNMATNRPVRIKSARRLRAAVGRATKAADPTETPQAKTSPKTTHNAKVQPERDTGEPVAKTGNEASHASPPVVSNMKPMSLLNAAIKILSNKSNYSCSAGLKCKYIVHLAQKQGLWKPGNGKTPANTLHASIMREIKTKGESSRFTKVGKGMFALNH